MSMMLSALATFPGRLTTLTSLFIRIGRQGIYGLQPLDTGELIMVAKPQASPTPKGGVLRTWIIYL